MARRVTARSVDRSPGAIPQSAQRIAAVERFPDDNPNPVMRIDVDGRLAYANPASAPVVEALGAVLGEAIPVDVADRLDEAAAQRRAIEVVADHRTYAVLPVRIADLGFTNLYGTDITAERAVVKFPDQNPNPVFRVDRTGTLVYANPAAAELVRGLSLGLGAALPVALRDDLLPAEGARAPRTLDVAAGDRWYALKAVDVPEFGFVNVYGTDITAERERALLAHENERLLLNILPEPIAQRLRDGEPLIADRFDDVTLLFADIVDFTVLSSTMTASELVTVLNEVFTVFDGLADDYGLEKVKTIGDAYMVVGGMSDGVADHTERIAAMALDLEASIARIEAAVRLGIAFRIGIHRGPVVAGVIGTRKFIYDVWGDTVNLASRMESTGVPGRIQVTHTVMERLTRSFTFEPRGLVDVKGKGPMPTWFLTARAEATARGRGEPHPESVAIEP
jgi:class 3 adenylate cyclase